MTAPTYRKPGRQTEAIEVTSARSSLRRFAVLPEGATVREKLEVAADAAVGVMYELLEFGESREKAEAARVLLPVWMHTTKPSGLAGSADLPVVDRRARALSELREPSPELRDVLREAGLVAWDELREPTDEVVARMAACGWVRATGGGT